MTKKVGDANWAFFHFLLSQLSETSSFFNFFYPPSFSLVYSLLVSSGLLLCGEGSVGLTVWRRSPLTLVDSREVRIVIPESEKLAILHCGYTKPQLLR